MAELNRHTVGWPMCIVFTDQPTDATCAVTGCRRAPAGSLELRHENTPQMAVTVCKGHGYLIVEQPAGWVFQQGLTGPARIVEDPRTGPLRPTEGHRR